VIPETNQKIKTIKERLFHNVSWLLGGKAISSIFSAIQTVIVARILGVNDYGLLALIIAYADILNNFFDFKVWETATKYISTFWTSEEREKTCSMIKLSYIIDISSGVLAFIISIITAKIASQYLTHSPQAYTLIWIYSFNLLIGTASTTSDAILRVFDKFRRIAFVYSFNEFFRLLLVSIALYLGMGIKGVLFSYVASSFLMFVVRLWAVSRTLEENQLERWWKSNLGLIRDQWKGIAWFLGNTSFTGTLNMASDNFLGVLVLGYYSGKEGAAYYKIAKSLVKIIIRLIDSLYEAIYPELVKTFSAGAIGDFKRLLKISTKNLSKITIPVAILIFAFSDRLITLIFGAKYIPSSNTLRIVTVAVLILQLTFWTIPAFLAFGKSGARNLITIASTAVYVGLLFLLVPKYSYVGAAWAFLASSAINSLISFWVMRNSLIREGKKQLNIQAT
jgi:O-antigen/teichoic acid export membrane protein